MHGIGSERRLHLVVHAMASICAMTLVGVLRTVANLMLHADDLVLVGADSATDLLQLHLLVHFLHGNNVLDIAL